MLQLRARGTQLYRLSHCQNGPVLFPLWVAQRYYFHVSQLSKKRDVGSGSSRGQSGSVEELDAEQRLPTFVKISGDERFYVAVKINGDEFVGMMDSGAQCTVVGPRFHQIINSSSIERKNSSYLISTADGTVHKTNTVFVLPITYDTRVIRAISKCRSCQVSNTIWC